MTGDSNTCFPFLCSAAVYLLFTTLLLGWGLAHNGWIFAYPLDDTYIHMAVAKNLAIHGVWGATQHQFNASSSSLVWTVMLAACFKVFGPWQWIPLIVNVLICLLIIYSSDRMLTGFGVPPRLKLLTLVCAVLVTPLPVLTLLGMEHSAHALATLLFLWLSVRLVATENHSRVLLGLAALTAGLDVALRVEGIFTVFVVCLFLLIRRSYINAVIICISGFLPLLVFGYYSSRHGGYWLPNSILMKGNLPDLTSFSGWAMTLGGNAIRSLFNSITLSVICLLIALFVLIFRHYRDTRNLYAPPNVLGAMVILIMLFHLQYARIGCLFRYEAYLIISGLIAVASLIAVVVPAPDSSLSETAINLVRSSRYRRRAFVVFALVALITYGARFGQSSMIAVLSMKDRYLEHVLTARFVKHYYNEATVVINDLGTIAFFSKAGILDVLGLGSIEPVRWQFALGKGFHDVKMRSWVRDSGAAIALLQTEFMDWHKGLPDTWVHVADWKIPRNLMFKDTIVGFYANGREKARELKINLREFSRGLPEDILIDFFPVCPFFLDTSGLFNHIPPRLKKANSHPQMSIEAPKSSWAKGGFSYDSDGQINTLGINASCYPYFRGLPRACTGPARSPLFWTAGPARRYTAGQGGHQWNRPGQW